MANPLKPRFIAGGPDEDDEPQAAAPQRKRYRCWAEQCPMPGTIFLGSLGSDGVCAWHYGSSGDEVKKITQAILDWDCVQLEINRGRRVLIAPDTLAGPAKQDAEFREAWARMLPAVMGSGWKPRLEPRPGEKLGEWVRRLERFLANRVKERLNPGHVIADDDAPTPTVADMRSRLRGSLKPPTGDFA